MANGSKRPIHNTIITFAALVISIAGLKAASGLVVPILAAVFLTIIITSAIYQLRESPLPDKLAVPVVALVGMLLVAGVGFILSASIQSFAQDADRIESLLQERFSSVGATITEIASGFGIDVNFSNIMSSITPSPSDVVGQVGNVASAVSGLLSNSFVLVLLVLFMLLEARYIPRKVRALYGPEAAAPGSRASEIVKAVRSYVLVKAIVASITGVTAGVACAIIGVPYAGLWGFVAFLLDFIPALGSIIAMVAPATIALVLLGVWPAVATVLAFMGINSVVGNFLEPRLHGRNQGLSALFIFISLLFWGWVFGPVGMLLAVPLTMVIKIVLSGTDEFREFAVLVDSGSDIDDSGSAPTTELAGAAESDGDDQSEATSNHNPSGNS